MGKNEIKKKEEEGERERGCQAAYPKEGYSEYHLLIIVSGREKRDRRIRSSILYGSSVHFEIRLARTVLCFEAKFNKKETGGS